MEFSERKKLAEEYEKWVSENKDVLDCPFTVISWLVGEGYVGKTKVADLEAKLAEKDTELHEFIRCALEDYGDNTKEIIKLKQQLAEKDKAIENWQTMYQSVIQSCHNGIEEDKRLREQIAVQSKWLGALDEVIKQLKEQLADKNKGDNDESI